MRIKTQRLVGEIVESEVFEHYPLGRHIVAAPGMCGGRTSFEYRRIDVRHTLGLMAAGRTIEPVAQAKQISLAAVQEALELAVGVLE
jgi:uncharacterized protein (DUF433 family)